MNYYVNCFEESVMWDGEVNRTHGLISGKSEEEIRINLVNKLSENWSFFGELEKYTRGVKFSDLSRFISNIGTDIGSNGGDGTGTIEDYNIKISEVYTDVKDAVDLYNRHIEDNTSFFIFFSGESANRFESIMDYLKEFKKEYGLSSNVGADKNFVSGLM